MMPHKSFSYLIENNRQSVRSNEVGLINYAQLAIDVRKDHVEMNCSRLLRHHHDDEVRHFGLFEEERGETVNAGRTRSLAEADQQHIFAERMNVATLESVIESPFCRSVVQNPLVL